MKNGNEYKSTSGQLDGITTTVITTLLTAFVISQQFIGNRTWHKWAAAFALLSLFLHYASFITANFAQIYILKDKEQLSFFFGWWTRKINGAVYLFTSVLFAISMVIIFQGGVIR